MKKLITLFLVLLSFNVMADEFGYMLQGKRTVVYKDGVKVGEMPEQPKKEKRGPAAVRNAAPLMESRYSMVVYYQIDAVQNNICYFREQDTSLACFKFLEKN